MKRILKGVTEQFSGNGRKLGYPTANIKTVTKLKDGVYFGYATLVTYTHHPAIIFIGTPTTVGDTERRVEAYLMDIPDNDYYGHTLELELHTYHRANQTFPSIEKLMEVMHDDEHEARRWFVKNA